MPLNKAAFFVNFCKFIKGITKVYHNLAVIYTKIWSFCYGIDR